VGKYIRAWQVTDDTLAPADFRLGT